MTQIGGFGGLERDVGSVLNLNNPTKKQLDGLCEVTRQLIKEKGLNSSNKTLVINGSTAVYMGPVAQMLRSSSSQTPNIGVLYASGARAKSDDIDITNSKTEIVERFAKENYLMVIAEGKILYDFRYSKANMRKIAPWIHPARHSTGLYEVADICAH